MYTEDFLRAKDAEKNEQLKKQYQRLQAEFIFWNNQLAQLQTTIAEKVQANTPSDQLQTEWQEIAALTETLKNYLEAIKCTTIFNFKTCKMSDKSMGVLEAQVTAMEEMRELLPSSDVLTTPRNHLSTCIANASRMTYDVSQKRVWARRAKLLLTGLVIAALVITVALLVMTPGVNIAAIAVSSLLAIKATLALFKLHAPVFVHTTIPVGSMHLPITAQVPGSLAPVTSGFSATLARKFAICNPTREVAARNMQAATINHLTGELNKKISALKEGDVKTFLLSVVDKADRMYNAGVGARFHETQQSKMQKARMILEVTAKIVEGDALPNSVNELLERKVKGNYTYGQLLNTQRNASLLRNRTSRFFKAVSDKTMQPQQSCVNLRQIVAAC